MKVGYEHVLEEHEKMEVYEISHHRLPTLADSLKIEGCCAHIPYVADQHRYTLMHLSAIHGVYYRTAANLREARNQLSDPEFGELCELIQFCEALRGTELEYEEADAVIRNFLDRHHGIES